MMRNILILLLALMPIINCNSNINKDFRNTFKTNDSAKCQYYFKFNAAQISTVSYPNFISIYTCRLNDLTLLFGSYQTESKDLSKNDYGGYRLLILNDKKEIVFRSKGAGDSRSFSPVFYKLNDFSPIFILIEIGDEGGSWGNNVYSILNNTIKDIGIIDLAILHKQGSEFSFENISESTQICKLGNVYRFDFNTDSVTLNHNGKNEKNLDAKKWHYIYDNVNFKLTKK